MKKLTYVFAAASLLLSSLHGAGSIDWENIYKNFQDNDSIQELMVEDDYFSKTPEQAIVAVVEAMNDNCLVTLSCLMQSYNHASTEKKEIETIISACSNVSHLYAFLYLEIGKFLDKDTFQKLQIALHNARVINFDREQMKTVAATEKQIKQFCSDTEQCVTALFPEAMVE